MCMVMFTNWNFGKEIKWLTKHLAKMSALSMQLEYFKQHIFQEI